MNELLTIPGLIYTGVTFMCLGAVLLYVTSGSAGRHAMPGELTLAVRRMTKVERSIVRQIILWSVFNPVSCFDYGSGRYRYGVLITLVSLLAGAAVVGVGLFRDLRSAQEGTVPALSRPERSQTASAGTPSGSDGS